MTLKVATVHLICGSTGAGKTTFAEQLASDRGAVRFSIDDWMVGLFGADAPAALSPCWIAPRVARCEERIWEVVRPLAVLGVSSVLDLGFQTVSQRDRWASLASSAGILVEVHVLDVGADERWRRVDARNQSRGETYKLTVTRSMFDYVERTWARPTQAEVDTLERRASAG